MQELNVRFTPTEGDARTITLRIGDPVQGPSSWSVRIEIVGYGRPYSAVIQGEDWAQSLELAAMVLPVALQTMGLKGTLEPSFYEREANGPDLSTLPPEVRAIFAPAVNEDDGLESR